MELQLYFDILRRRALVIVIVTAVALVVVTAAGVLRTPIYKAEATVRILLDTGISDYVRREDYNERLIRTYEYILSSSPLLEKVLARLEPRTSSMSVGALRQQLNVGIVPETELITITIENEDPVLARDLANMFATALTEYTEGFDNQTGVTQLLEQELTEIEKNLEDERAQLDKLLTQGALTTEVEAIRTRIKNLETSYDLRWRQYESARLSQSLQVNSITLIEPASTPRRPANALGLKDVALTLVLGLSGGIGLALVLENVDTRIRSPQQLERLTHLPTLGVVSRGVLSVNGSGQIGGEKGLSLAEAYRLISLNLYRLAQSSSLNTILVTSVGPGEGKTTVATNLARVLAERGTTVFLVEGDMRHPSLDGKFGANDGHIGLSSLLSGVSSLEQVIYPTEQSSLFVIGGGPVPSNPASLLASPTMDRVLDYLGSQGQVTLIDTPPVLGLADVSLLASRVDGIILIVHQNLTHREQMSQALKQLEATQANVIGSIFVQRGNKIQSYV